MGDDILSYVADSPKDADKSLAKWIHQGAFAGEPFQDFVPPGALASIGLLIEDLTRDWPWPYNARELEMVLDTLPQDASSRKVVNAARVYLAKFWVQIGGPKRQPNPIEELRCVKKTADELLIAIKALSNEAESMLQTSQRLHVPDAPDTIRLRYIVDAFLHEHRLLRNLPAPQPIDRRGRKVEVLGRQFQAVLDQIYDDAYASVRPKRGFPSFERAIVEPLKKWHLSFIEEKSRQDRRRPRDRSTRQRRIKQDKSNI